MLDEWLQCVLQAIDPWLSSKDIDRGSLWFSEINDQLKDTCTGIICITKENKEKPWILFEAGALAKGLSSNRVCTFLIDLEPYQIKDPLAQFNHTLPTKDGLWNLVRTLNNCLGDKSLTEKILDKVFETYWPNFEKTFKEIKNNQEETSGVEGQISEDEILSQILAITRTLDKRLRRIEDKTVIKRSPQTTEGLVQSAILQRIIDEKFNEERTPSETGVLGVKHFLRSIAKEDATLRKAINGAND